MKKLLSILLCLLLLAGCAETYDGPTESKAVLSTIQTAYYDTETENHQYGRTEYAYDIYGNQSIELDYRLHSFDEKQEPYRKTVRTYDKNGNCIRQRQYDTSGWFPRKLADIRYKYDDRGRMISHQDKLDPQFCWTAVYDDEAHTMTCTYAHAVSVSYFDENGWTIRQETTFQNGETSAIINEFRADGQRVSVRYEESGTVTLHSYTYDDQGRVVTMSETTDDGTRVLFRYEYGEKHKTQYNLDGTKIVTTYNDDGSIHYFYHTDSADRVTQDGMYYYTEILVPVREEVTP